MSRKTDTRTSFVTTESDGAHTAQMSVEGMHCASCALVIEAALHQEPDVTARINLATRRLSLHWRGDVERIETFIKKVSAIGYKISPFNVAQLQEGDKSEEKMLRRGLVISGVASVLTMALPMLIAAHDVADWSAAGITVPVMLYAGLPFFRSAWQALSHKRTNMDVPISVALLLTTGMSLFETITRGTYTYFDSVAMLLFLLLIGRILDNKTRGRARKAAEDLLMMMSGKATIRADGKMRELPIQDLQAGMLLHVAMGEKIAADGVVETGLSDIDPSLITGETVTQKVAKGDRVIGGMINLSAPLTVRLSASSEDSLLSDIIRLMEKAEQGHAAFVRLADRVARAYTPVVHGLALITFIIWCPLLGRAWQPSLLAAMTVLIITCPCAVGLAVPAVQVLTSGRLFRRGILLKSADALERLAQVDTIVFDKTGTLTEGRPRLANPQHIGSLNMQIAASLAVQSQHPLARALHDNYGGKLIEMQAREFPGQGLEAIYEGKTLRLGSREFAGDMKAPADDSLEIWLNIEGQEPLRFAFADNLRSDAVRVVATLKHQGYRLMLLSGDRAPTVAKIALEVGIEDYRAAMSPVDKATIIEEIRNQGGRVLMVGDGLNDAPALASADVSLSPSSALDIAQNAADLVFQGKKLAPVLEVLTIAKRAEKLVRQNFVISFLYNAFAVPLAMLGLVTPLVAAVAMASSSILVVLNAQRITRG